MKNSLRLPLGLRILTAVSMTGALSGCGTLDLPGGLGGAPWFAKSAPEALNESPPAAESEPPPPIEDKPKPSPLYEWKGEGRKVSRVVINIDEQKARFYDGDEQIGWATVATGVRNFPTPTGKFEVIEKKADKRSNLYGKIYNRSGRVIKSDARLGRDPIPAGGRFAGAEMPYFLRLTHDGVGLHAGSIPRPGHPASHGCIRLPRQLALVVFGHVSHGTPVTIIGRGPSYGDYAEQLRVAARERAAAERAAAEAAARAPDVTLAAGEPLAEGGAMSAPTEAVAPVVAPTASPVAVGEPPAAPAVPAGESVGAADAAGGVSASPSSAAEVAASAPSPHAPASAADGLTAAPAPAPVAPAPTPAVVPAVPTPVASPTGASTPVATTPAVAPAVPAVEAPPALENTERYGP